MKAASYREIARGLRGERQWMVYIKDIEMYRNPVGNWACRDASIRSWLHENGVRNFTIYADGVLLKKEEDALMLYMAFA